METNSSAEETLTDCHPVSTRKSTEKNEKRLSNGYEETEADSSIHPFNLTNVTVIETKTDQPTEFDATSCSKTQISYEGSDSGVEVIENSEDVYVVKRSNSQEFHSIVPSHSCDSSIISYCYEDGYSSIRRSPSQLEEYKIRNGDATSEGGSESSSVTGCASSKESKTPKSIRKRSTLTGAKSRLNGVSRSRSKTPSATSSDSVKSVVDNAHDKTSNGRHPINRSKSLRQKQPPTTVNNAGKTKSDPASSVANNKKKIITQTNDGRWPSVNSKPAPVMARSFRGTLLSATSKTSTPTEPMEKSATLPRTRREKSLPRASLSRTDSKDNGARKLLFKNKNSSDNMQLQFSTPTAIIKNSAKTQISLKITSQEPLSGTDIQSFLSSVTISPITPRSVGKSDKDAQVSITCNSPLQDNLAHKYNLLLTQFEEQSEKLKISEQKYMTLLNDFELQNEKLQRTEHKCEMLQKDLNKAVNSMLQHQEDEEAEHVEMEEFVKAEKNAMTESLIEAENEIDTLVALLQQKDEEISRKEEECKFKRQEVLVLKAQLVALEAKTGELLENQENAASEVATALQAIISRLLDLVTELMSSYNITEQDLEDNIFHNEAYSSSSPDATPEKCKTLNDELQTRKGGSSLVYAVINAIRNATKHSLFSNISQNDSADSSSSNAMLDSETEPALMMEPVLEDVVVPDGHSHNMVSTNLRLTRNDNLAFSNKAGFSSLHTFLSPFALVDQVLQVDEIITRLLKVLRIVLMENDNTENDM